MQQHSGDGDISGTSCWDLIKYFKWFTYKLGFLCVVTHWHTATLYKQISITNSICSWWFSACTRSGWLTFYLQCKHVTCCLVLFFPIEISILDQNTVISFAFFVLPIIISNECDPIQCDLYCVCWSLNNWIFHGKYWYLVTFAPFLSSIRLIDEMFFESILFCFEISNQFELDEWTNPFKQFISFIWNSKLCDTICSTKRL